MPHTISESRGVYLFPLTLPVGVAISISPLCTMTIVYEIHTSRTGGGNVSALVAGRISTYTPHIEIIGSISTIIHSTLFSVPCMSFMAYRVGETMVSHYYNYIIFNHERGFLL